MHKEGFSKHIAQQHNITQKAAHDVIDTFCAPRSANRLTAERAVSEVST